MNYSKWSFKKLRYYDKKSSCVTQRDNKEDSNITNQGDTEEIVDA